MTRTNWTRFFIGAIVATIILFLTDGFFHEKIVKADWEAVYAALGAKTPTEHNPLALAYFFLFDLGRAAITLYIYVLMRGCCGPGPKTAVCAAIIGWLAFSITCPAQFVPLGFLSTALWLKIGAFQLVTSIVANLVGAALYKDPAGPVTA